MKWNEGLQNLRGGDCSRLKGDEKNIKICGITHQEGGSQMQLCIKSLHMAEKQFDLEDRLINFASDVLDVTEKLPKSIGGNHIAGQMVRSGTAPCLQYGEAQSAESRQDFIHKMKIALKELRETFIGLKLTRRKGWCSAQILNPLINENNELISIFVKSIDTAKKNLLAEKKVKRSTS